MKKFFSPKMRRLISRNITNLRGWSTNRKIVVIESDDWGAIRTPSKEVLHMLQKEGIQTFKCHYVTNDALATATDLNQLFGILKKIGKYVDKPPVVTANVIMANPDFEMIRNSNFKKYYYEWFTESLNRYPHHKDSFSIWKEGINEQLFHPQFHGREHVQVFRWLKWVRQEDSDTAKAFKYRLCSLSNSVTFENRNSYLAAYDVDNESEEQFVKESIKIGTEKFNNLFGYKSLSSIAPNYTWNDAIEKVLKECGVKYIQGGKVQRKPSIKSRNNRIKRHYLGEKNLMNQIYLVRNCTFEPASNQNVDWVKTCMDEIKSAFMWNKPAIIESHRVNYIGYINPKNRDHNLRLLEDLLKQIVKNWPEVEFMTSDQLGKIIEGDDG